MLGTGNRKLNRTWLKPSKNSSEQLTMRKYPKCDNRDTHSGGLGDKLDNERWFPGRADPWVVEPVLTSFDEHIVKAQYIWNGWIHFSDWVGSSAAHFSIIPRIGSLGFPVVHQFVPGSLNNNTHSRDGSLDLTMFKNRDFLNFKSS